MTTEFPRWCVESFPPRNISSLTHAAKRGEILLAVGDANLQLFYLALCQPTDPALHLGSEKPRSYTLGICGVVHSVPLGATQRPSECISHHLDDFLRSCRPLPTHLMHFSYGLVTVFRAGEPGEVPALLLHLIVDHAASIDFRL
jgi:hypothetical protein